MSTQPTIHEERTKNPSPCLSVDSVVKFASRLHRDDGAAAVSFILCFPIFLTIVAIFIQFTLLLNAKMMVDHAARMAGRAAVTCLPEQHVDKINSAAYMALVPLCPQARDGLELEASNMYDGLRRMGVDVPPTFAERYSYAMAATKVEFSPPTTDTSTDPNAVNYLRHAGQETEITLTYRFYLTVPVAAAFIATGQDNVAGVNGRFYDLVSKIKVQTSHSRKASANSDGWPSAPNGWPNP